MQAKEVPLREIRNLIRQETNPPSNAHIDVWWDGSLEGFKYILMLPGQFSPYGQGEVLCDGDMEVVPT